MKKLWYIVITCFLAVVAIQTIRVVHVYNEAEVSNSILLGEWKLKRIKKCIRFFGASAKIASTYAPIILATANKYEIDPYMIVSLIHKESNFNSKLVGSAGEIGAAQIMPFWADKFGFPARELFDLSRNIDTCGRILHMHRLDYKGDMFLAVRAYNGKSSFGTEYSKDVHRNYNRVVTIL